MRRSPEDWAAQSFAVGKHPWTDLYDVATTVRIAKCIGLTSEKDCLRLRLLLAAAAEDCYQTFSFVGGAATPTKKNTWRDDVIKDAKRLLLTLKDTSDLHPSAVSMPRERTLRIRPKTVLTRQVDEVSEALAGLIASLEEGGTPTAEDDEPNPQTQHMRYLQYAVDQMTGVFVYFKGLEAVVRSQDKKGVYGVFPDFIRMTATPVLRVCYEGFAEKEDRLGNLDAQIRAAVAKAARAAA